MNQFKHFLDSSDEKSQLNTPANLKGAIFYIAESFNKTVNQIQTLRYRIPEDGKIIFTTLTDNTDISWIEAFNPYHIIFNSNDKEYHERVLECPGHKNESDYFTGLLKKENGRKLKDWEEALDEITAQINVSTGLTHPDDKKFAKDVLKNLYNSGSRPINSEIRVYLLQKNWKDNYTKDVIKIWNSFFKKVNEKL